MPGRRIVAKTSQHSARHEGYAVLVHSARCHAAVRYLDDHNSLGLKLSRLHRLRKAVADSGTAYVSTTHASSEMRRYRQRM